MANYTTRELGTAANLAACLDGDPDIASECMSVANHNIWATALSAGDNVYLADTGGDYNTTMLSFKASGSAVSDISHLAYPGHTPVFDGSVDITESGYKWTESTTKPGEYFCEDSGGGDPSLIDPGLVFMDDVSLTKGGVVPDFDGLGVLDDLEWGYGRNDGQAYDTVYVRDDANGNPTTSGVVIEVPQIGCFRLYRQTYIMVDGIHIKRGNDENGGFRCDGGQSFTHHVTVQNCTVEWCAGEGITLKAADSLADSNTVSYCGAHNIEAGGSPSDKLLRVTFSNNDTHHSRTTGYSGDVRFDGYGLKFLWVDDCTMVGNYSHHNELDGIDLDGSSGEGCVNCHIYKNTIHDNGQAGILVEIDSHHNHIYLNRIWDNGVLKNAYEIHLWQRAHSNEIWGNIAYRTKDNGFSNILLGGGGSGAGAGSYGTLIYGNILDGGGFALRGIYLEGDTTPQGTKIKNNIIIGTVTHSIYLYTTLDDYTGFESDYNLLRREDELTNVISRQWNQYTLATWFSTFGFAEHSIGGDPLFTDRDNGDYTLLDGSPCIDTGVNLGEPYNEAFMPITTWPGGIVTGDPGDY